MQALRNTVLSPGGVWGWGVRVCKSLPVNSQYKSSQPVVTTMTEPLKNINKDLAQEILVHKVLSFGSAPKSLFKRLQEDAL